MRKVFGERALTAEFIISEANEQRSREQGVLAANATEMLPGTALGRLLGAANAPVVTAGAGNAGNGAFGAPVIAANTKPGVYRVTITAAAANAGEFQVEDPDGQIVGNGNVAAAFNKGGIQFTIADGAVDFAVNDYFTLNISYAGGQLTPYNPTGVDGSQNFAGYLFDRIPISAVATRVTYVAREAEVNGWKLVFVNALDAGQKAEFEAKSAAQQIIVRY